MPARTEKGKIRITAAYPIELHYIKALFLHRRYRQCIDACRHVLLTSGDETAEHALQVAFANFYLGLAHDELARLMHDFSHAKVPALDQAEQFFRDALRLLPSAEELAFTLRARKTTVHERSQTTDDPFSSSPGAHVPTVQRATRNDSDDYDPYNYYSPTIGFASPIDVGRNGDKLPCSPQPVSRETSGSDLTDLESHSSFDQIMTPHRVLERDLSRMSLIDEMRSPPRPMGLPRTTSTTASLLEGFQSPPRTTGIPRATYTSNSLMRPIRPISPPKAYRVPPMLPDAGKASPSRRMSRLPRLSMRSPRSEAPSGALSPRSEGKISPSCPVSPLKPEADEAAAESDSTVSPASPRTPVRQAMGAKSPLHGFSPSTEGHGILDHREQDVIRHLEAMRLQLDSHLEMLERAKDETVAKQRQRENQRRKIGGASSTSPSLSYTRSSNGRGQSCSSSNSGPHIAGGSGNGRIQQMRSFWSFEPAAITADEKRRRIQAGRQRGWMRERFRAERYQELAEKAMAELYT
ncbi:hypothetical protein KC318_g4969 [Hortaea werneckii]|uniref:Uncharacterized protein n=1 Tax=Hortaea werneckii TaxID=91943 RepID=A0A3M6ZC15_HORWE|nr:hypothetical protein KC334_g2804 [Hortaea werneckii]KAI7013417.1 hypothetical protein KC355_g5037 [Hortaea werneckii]KAI7668947.1 hypothetical protein KC318_g4969 [Hortaea werneckii]RMY12866.1 hypothetical protein D0867_07630 [Hortaea werneckii]RMY35686.1 hypothetical protein D0866_04436 [Hortaea werneckii]